MKVGTVLFAVVLAAAAVGGTYWVARSDSATPPAAVESAAVPTEDPVPSKTGPHPKVVLPEETFKFDMMAVGETWKHTFVVRNEGEAPLKLGKPVTTCQCTVSEAAKNEIPPGGEGTVTLEWKPEFETMEFDKGATLKTNDPKKPEITLSVSGRVDRLLRMDPEGSWNVGEVSGDTPRDLSGFMFSRLLDRFGLESVTSSNPLLTVESEPASEEDLKKFEAKSGYRLSAKLEPGLPVGRFAEKITVKTDIDDEKFDEVTFDFVGVRSGPIQVLPTPGTKWNPDNWSVDLDRFSSQKGKTGAVSLFVSGLPEGQSLEFSDVASSEPYVTIDLKRDDSFRSENRQRYQLTFAVSPGSPAATHRGKGSVKVEAKTNHPEVSSMKFSVQFIATP